LGAVSPNPCLTFPKSELRKIAGPWVVYTLAAAAAVSFGRPSGPVLVSPVASKPPVDVPAIR
jgi:hypothetical protein